MTLAVGTLLQDKRYQIQAVLNSTDIEIVYQAVHTYLDRTVLLKQLRNDVDWAVAVQPTGRAVMARLLRWSQCQHPCLGDISDCFEEEGHVYLVLPTHGALTMAQWLQTNGSVKPLEMLIHLRSLIDIFDKFHQNDLIYGQLSPDSLHYRSETNEMVVTDISWRMFIADLLGDRHRSHYSKTLDLQRLAYIACSFLTGDSRLVQTHQELQNSSTDGGGETQYAVLGETIVVPSLHSIRTISNIGVENVIAAALYPNMAQCLTPTGWFIALEQAICSPTDVGTWVESTVEPYLLKGSLMEGSLIEGSLSFNVPSYSGEEVLTQSITDETEYQLTHNAIAMSPPDQETTSLSSMLKDDTKEELALSSVSNDSIGDDEYGDELNNQRQNSSQWLRITRGLPLLLGATSLVAAVSGGLLGYVFRVQDTGQLEQSPLFGNEIFGREQEFPPSDHWPGLNSQIEDSPSVLFERSPTQQAIQPTPATPVNEGDALLSNSSADSGDSSREPAPAPPVIVNGNRAINPDGNRGVSEAGTSNDGPDQGSNSELNADTIPPSKPAAPEKVPNPAASSQSTPISPSPETRPSPQTPQSDPPRVDEMPPSLGQPSRSPESTIVPTVPTGSPAQIPVKKPKSLITPVFPSSEQSQSVDVDATDV